MSKALDKHFEKTIGHGRCAECGGMCDMELYKKKTGKDPWKVHECECNDDYWGEHRGPFY